MKMNSEDYCPRCSKRLDHGIDYCRNCWWPGWWPEGEVMDYCKCRWPKWELVKANVPERYYLYCHTCNKTASPLILELIDDGEKSTEIIVFNREEFFDWYSTLDLGEFNFPGSIEFN